MYNITTAKAAVKSAIKGYLHKDSNGKYVMKERNRLPIYLEGAPGIGKTEIVEQISQELGLGFVSFSMTHHTRNSLLGLPVIKDLENGDKYTSYTMSEVIAKVLEQVEQGKIEGILLLDEFPCMSETIMPVMLAFLQTKNIGLHTLPEGWVIVLCGNPPEYNKSARKFDSAILDRIRKIPITFDAKHFIEYGRSIGLEDIIMDYLELHPKHTYCCVEKNNEKELVTCRGWENLSHAYTLYKELEQEADLEFVKQFIKSEEIALEFIRYEKQRRIGMSVEEIDEILQGKCYEKHRKRIMELSYNQQWQLTDYMCERLTTKETKEEMGVGKYKEISGWIDNVLDMLAVVDEKGVLSEKAFCSINKNDLLLKVVSNIKTRQYLVLCDKLLGNVGA